MATWNLRSYCLKHNLVLDGDLAPAPRFLILLMICFLSVCVLQSTYLGPILFLVYTADLKYQLQAEAVRNINSDLKRVKSRSDDHGLLLNSDKCSVLQASSVSRVVVGLSQVYKGPRV
ncbi:hypothetical protein J6590_080439 [Homalodisca vitripennis]|nr:hypothetical protein J6590_080439 [Homalodisca vitripennis]